MRQFLRNNGLSIALFGVFALLQWGLSVVGHRHHNQEREDRREPPISYGEYLSSGAFLEATMENWESEFLQMFAYVIMTAFLFQKGSAESKKPEKPEAVDRDPPSPQNKPDVPWPVRKGGIILKLYENSLSLALFLLFVISFVLHAVGGVEGYNQQALAHGGETVTMLQYMGTSQFWFESLQNWQSEFFSIGVIVALSIVLRQKGSPESKPVDSPYSMTGRE